MMEKSYNPAEIETKWYQYWESNNYFSPSGSGDPFCIVIPPPNITGTLHMGHAFQDTIMDILIRYHRMKGRKTLWLVGTDHAGIATQMVVERQLAQKGMNRQDLGRQTFLEKIWDWKNESGGAITRQLRRIGASVDWKRERFTMDPGLVDAVNEVFVRLYEKGLIYRGKKLVNWDPVFESAISDLEVESQEEIGHLWQFRYPLVKKGIHHNDYIVVATTRPETILGDAAVAVSPNDPRYQHLIGEEIELPLMGRKIPIIADDYVDPEFGTGCVKITPAHDFNDYAVGLRHHLPMINVFTTKATLNDNAPVEFRGLDRYVAREKILDRLKELGLFEKADDNHRMMVPRGDRSRAVIEPYLTDQWFVHIAPLAQPAINVVKEKKLRFSPDTWEKTYFDWMTKIEDWCISRQLWWGHRIPAWYDNEGNVYVGRTLEEVRKKYHLDETVALDQDEDVLDTWFSSALWPFSTLGWPEKTPDLQTFYPTSVLVTGFDIIFFWVARMIMMGLEFMGDIPFRTVYVHGLIRDSEGQKMSKSKGNVLDPIDLIDGIDLDSLLNKRIENMMQPSAEKQNKIQEATRLEFPDGIPAFGADALRFTFSSLASTGRDIRFDLGRTQGYRNFCNKLWNASRFVLLNISDDFPNTDSVDFTLADRWILSRLERTQKDVEEFINNYRFDLASNVLHDFVWHQYCDWYLELAKSILNQENADPAIINGTKQTLLQVLETILRLLHPFIPFITEEIWHVIAPLSDKQGPTISQEPWPEENATNLSPDSENVMHWIQQVIQTTRKIRSERNIPPHLEISLVIKNHTEEEKERLEIHYLYIKTLGKLKSMHFVDEKEEVPQSALGLVNAMKLMVPLSDLIDIKQEISRLNKEILKLEGLIKSSLGKLGNDKFLANAPEAIVTKEKNRLEDNQSAIAKLKDQLRELSEFA